MQKKRFFSIRNLSIAIICLAALSLTAQAAIQDGNQNIYVGPSEIIESNFIQAGGTIDFNGQVQKDVIIAGGNINISGPVKGDVIITGGNIRIKGEVGGNVRVAGGTIEVDNKVGKSVSVAGGTVIIGQNAEVGWDVLFLAGSIEIRGKVNGNVNGSGGSVILASEVGGNVDLKIAPGDGQLILYPQTDIKGNLTYEASQEAEIKEGAKVSGETTYKHIAKPYVPSVGPAKKVLAVSYFTMKAVTLLSLLIVGLLIILLAGKTSKTIGEKMLEKPWSNIGWGLIYLIVVPIVLVLIAITVVGIPLALIALFAYFISIYVAKIFVGIVLGQKLLRWLGKKQEVSLVWSVILGLIVFSILTNIPVIGGIIWFLGICWALGAIVETKKQMLKQIEK